MKKLLVLLMVLGLMSTANAALTTYLSLDGSTVAPASDTITVGSIINVSIVSTVGAPTAMNLELDDTAAGALAQTGAYTHGDWIYTGGTVQGMTQYAAAGSIASIWGPTITGYPGFFEPTAAGAPGGLTTAGEWFSINYQCTGLGDTYITLYDSQANELSQMVVHQTPEPITMTLLGLGGLFLRRRK
jgi:hypothetical protein